MANSGARASSGNHDNEGDIGRKVTSLAKQAGAKAVSDSTPGERRSATLPIAAPSQPSIDLEEAAACGVLQTSRLGPYQIVCQLASGGMASVYLALFRSDEGFEKLCAVKRIHPHLASDRAFTSMFADEARIAARISHPFVCSVFSFGRSQDSHYIAMEFLRGEPLSVVMKHVARTPELGDDPRFPAIAARLAANFAEGLFAAHSLRDERGKLLDVVHRDVTPQNLFVLFDGSVRVTDFGIAQARRRLHQTEGRKIKGKLSYVAPEQLNKAPVDHRADIWSLGVTLWELLVGRRLFLAGSEGETLGAVLSRTIVAPSTYRATVPPELDRIVLRALSRDPSERYQTARELARDLERFLSAIGDQVPAMDVADWMTNAFPQGVERIRALTELAGQLSASTPNDFAQRALTAPPPPNNAYPASFVFLASPEVAAHDRPSISPTREYPAGIGPDTLSEDSKTCVVDESDLEVDEMPADTLARAPKPRLLLVEEQTQTRSLILDGNHGRTLAIVGSVLLLAVGAGSLLLRHAHSETTQAVAAPAAPKSPLPAPTQPVSPSKAELAPVPVQALPVERTPAKRRVVAPVEAPSATHAAAVASAAPSPAILGDVMITMPSGSAEVLEGGKSLGRAPGSFRLSPGAHQLVLRTADGATHPVQVQIRPGAPTLVSVDTAR